MLARGKGRRARRREEVTGLALVVAGMFGSLGEKWHATLTASLRVTL